MNFWDNKWLEEMDNNSLEILTGSRYMDDIRAFLASIKEGWRWWQGELRYCNAWRMEDLKEGKSRTERTAIILIEIMNSILPFLKFTLEIGDQFKDNKLPTLDLKLWMENGLIEFEYYEKPMSTNLVVHAKTALSENTKFSSLTQEVVRRLLHTSSIDRLLP